jgi:hypothetical protein
LASRSVCIAYVEACSAKLLSIDTDYDTTCITNAAITLRGMKEVFQAIRTAQHERRAAPDCERSLALLGAETELRTWMSDPIGGPIKELKSYATHWRVRDHQRQAINTHITDPEDKCLHILWDFKELLRDRNIVNVVCFFSRFASEARWMTASANENVDRNARWMAARASEMLTENARWSARV